MISDALEIASVAGVRALPVNFHRIQVIITGIAIGEPIRRNEVQYIRSVKALRAAFIASCPQRVLVGKLVLPVNKAQRNVTGLRRGRNIQVNKQVVWIICFRDLFYLTIIVTVLVLSG